MTTRDMFKFTWIIIGCSLLTIVVVLLATTSIGQYMKNQEEAQKILAKKEHADWLKQQNIEEKAKIEQRVKEEMIVEELEDDYARAATVFHKCDQKDEPKAKKVIYEAHLNLLKHWADKSTVLNYNNAEDMKERQSESDILISKIERALNAEYIKAILEDEKEIRERRFKSWELNDGH